MNKPLLLLAAAVAVLPLAACNTKPETQAQAGGEILEGSISDAMLPLDTATSQPPLAPKSVTTGGGDKDADGGDKPEPDKKADAPAPKAAPTEPE